MAGTVTFQRKVITPDAVVRFDQLGIGPIEGTVRVDDDALGLGIPLVDVGFFVDYRVGARLIVEAGMSVPDIDLTYTVEQGAMVDQTSLSEYNPDNIPGLTQFVAEGGAIYLNDPIAFSSATARAVKGGMNLDAIVEDGVAYVSAGLQIDHGLRFRDFFIEVGFGGVLDFFSKTFKFGGSVDVVPFGSTTVDLLDDFALLGSGQELLKYSSDANIFEGSDLFAGSFVRAPIPPDYVPQPAAVVGEELQPGLVTVSIADTADPFAKLQFDVARFITENTAVPLKGVLKAGDLTGTLEVLRANLAATLSVGQEQQFTPEAIRVDLKLYAENGAYTGQSLSGVLGDQLSFDSIQIGRGYVEATYTLYGAVESRTGFVAAAGVELGLLAGSLAWNGFGPNFSIGFGPLIPLPSPTFETELITLITDRTAIDPVSFTVQYKIDSQRDAKGSEGVDNTDVNSDDQTPVHFWLGGNDIIDGHANRADIFDGGTGNDVLRGATLLSANDPLDDLPAFVADGDIFYGQTGNDVILAGNGDDRLDGGEGSDFLFADAGDDLLRSYGTDGVDRLFGGEGFDTANIYRSGAAEAWDVNFSDLAKDGAGEVKLPDGTGVSGIERWYVTTGFGDDTLRGGATDDILATGAGDDVLDGAGGFDTVDGGGGDDELRYFYDGATGQNNDLVIGGAGIDTIYIGASGTANEVLFNLSGIADLGLRVFVEDNFIEKPRPSFIGLLINNSNTPTDRTNDEGYDGEANPDLRLAVRRDVERLDFINTSSIAKNEIVGGVYGDTINVGGGTDRIDGWLGRDTLYAGAGDDLLLSWDADALVDGGAGRDLLRLIRTGDKARTTLDMNAMADDGTATLGDGTILRGLEQLQFLGGAGADTITGRGFADAIDAGGGNDVLDGGGGGDQVLAGPGRDTVISAERSFAAANILSGGQGEDLLRLTWDGGGGRLGTVALVVDGQASATQTLVNGTTIEGFERFEITGGIGDDVISGGNAQTPDQVLDLSIPGFPTTIKVFKGVSDLLSGGDGNDIIVGNGGRDILSGGAGNDRVTIAINDGDQADGGSGYDTLVMDVGFSFNGRIAFTTERLPYEIEITETDPVTGRPITRTETRVELVTTFADGTRATGFERVEFIGFDLTKPISAVLTPVIDVIDGSDLNDTIDGAGGFDVIDGKLGDDFLIAKDLGFDPLGPIAQLTGGGGDDIMQVDGVAALIGGDGFDTAILNMAATTQALDARFGSLASGGNLSDLVSLAGVESVSLTTGAGNDRAVLGAGSFELDLGGGVDSAVVQKGGVATNQSFGFAALSAITGPSANAATAATSSADTASIPLAFVGADLSIADAEFIRVITGAGRDVIDFTGGDARGWLDGGRGSDRLRGGALGDVLVGGAGDDMLAGGGGGDLFLFTPQSGRDRISDFGADDVFVTTRRIADKNRDNIIDFGGDKLVDLAGGGRVAIQSEVGGSVVKMEHDGSFSDSGVTYYVYSLLGSAAGLADARAALTSDPWAA